MPLFKNTLFKKSRKSLFKKNNLPLLDLPSEDGEAEIKAFEQMTVVFGAAEITIRYDEKLDAVVVLVPDDIDRFPMKSYKQGHEALVIKRTRVRKKHPFLDKKKGRG